MRKTSSDNARLIESVKRYAESVRRHTAVTLSETEREKAERVARLLRDPRAFQEYYFPHLKQSPGYLTKAAAKILRRRDYFGWWMMFRGARKTTWVSLIVPLMLLARGELKFMVLIAASENAAIRLLANLQMQLENNQRFTHDFGPQHNYGSWADGEFITRGGTAFIGMGMGQSPRGLNIDFRRPDYIVATDLDSREMSKNPARCKEMYNWLKEDVMGTEETGSEGLRFVYDNNYFSKTSIGHLFKTNDAGMEIERVDIMDKDGNPAADFISKEWIDKKRGKIGYRAFMREYMNTPVEEGSVFRADWIKWKKPLPLRDYDYLLTYCDYAFKGKKSNDYTAIVLLGKKGRELHILRAFCRQCGPAVAIRWHYDLAQDIARRGVHCYHVTETGFAQDMILDDEYAREGTARGWHMDILKDGAGAKGKKQERIEAAAVKWELGLVWYNELMRDDPDMQTGIDQTLAFEKGSSAHDDFPDACEGAVTWAERRSREGWGSESVKPAMGKSGRAADW